MFGSMLKWYCDFPQIRICGFPQVDPAQLEGSFGARGHTELGVNMAQVKFHGAQRDTQGKRHLFVALALDQKRNDLFFTFTKLGLSHFLSVTQNEHYTAECCPC